MNRRDFLKFSLYTGITAAIPFNLAAMTSCTDDEPITNDKIDLSGAADMLVLGNIITIDPNLMFADAMTIKNGYIQYVGTKNKALTFCNEDTVKVDYGHLSVYPGFMEAHCHGSGAGQVEKAVKMYDAMSYKEYQDILADYIRKNPNDEEYKIAGWRVLGEPPTKELLDEICSDKPVFGGSLDGHCTLLNTKAMEKMNIDKAFAQKYGPVMVPVDAAGNPTGYVTEAASAQILSSIPISVDSAKEYIRSWETMAFRNGYVAACEAGVNLVQNAHEAYVALAKEKGMKLRTRAFYNVVQDDACEETIEKIAQMKKECNDEYYKVVGVKLFIDGVVESHTGLLCEVYADDPTTKGLNRYPDTEKLQNLVLSAHKHGLSTHTHTIGDGAVKYMLDAIEYSKNTLGDTSVRDMLAHIELIKTEDIKRFAKYNVSAIVAALWGPKNSITPWKQEVDLLGEERANSNYCIANSFVEKGINTAQHTDYPVSQEINVPKTIYCAVTRCLPHTGDETLRIAKEAVSRLEILRELTINVAYLWNEENHLGTLTPGKVANYVVYDCDFIDDDLEKIPNAQLKHVVVDGEEVYTHNYRTVSSCS